MALSRREFLKGAVATGTTASLVGLGVMGAYADEAAKPTIETMKANASGDSAPKYTWETPPPAILDSQIVETIDADVVILGAGMAGLAAALYASENGAKTVVIEKAGSVTNHRMGTAAFNARCQVDNGLRVDRNEAITETWNITNGFQGRLSLYSRWVDNSGPYVNWLEKHMNDIGSHLVAMPVSFATGVESGFWKEFTTFIFFTDPKTGLISANGGSFDWAQAMADRAVEKYGAKFYFNLSARQLVRGGKPHGKKGRVEAVIAERRNGEYVRVNASKGIVIATGDFWSNKEMVSYYNRLLLKCVDSMAEPSNVGDGHMMGMWIGADMDDIAAGDLFPHHTATNNLSMRPKANENQLYTNFQGLTWRPAVANLAGAIKVDGAGRRIGNEDLIFQSYAQVAFSTYDGLYWGLFDSAWKEKFAGATYGEYELFAINNQTEVDKEVENKLILKFDSLDELIKGCGFDEKTLKETLERYNKLCDLGEDRDFLKSSAWMKKLDTPPYYAAQMGVSITSTRGGLKIDDYIRVLDKKGIAIPGLYAAGNASGSFYGNVYPPNAAGSGIGHGQCFGWLAVSDMLGIETI